LKHANQQFFNDYYLNGIVKPSTMKEVWTGTLVSWEMDLPAGMSFCIDFDRIFIGPCIGAKPIISTMLSFDDFRAYSFLQNSTNEVAALVCQMPVFVGFLQYL
jgi:hypothetical protein